MSIKFANVNDLSSNELNDIYIFFILTLSPSSQICILININKGYNFYDHQITFCFSWLSRNISEIILLYHTHKTDKTNSIRIDFILINLSLVYMSYKPYNRKKFYQMITSRSPGGDIKMSKLCQNLPLNFALLLFIIFLLFIMFFVENISLCNTS